MNPARLIRKSVAALNEWFEKAEKEEMEQRMEVARPAVDERPSRERITRDLDGSKVIDFRTTTPPVAGIGEVVGSSSRSLTPLPEDFSNRTPAPITAAGTPPVKFRERQHTPSPDVIVFAPRNDRVFRERNRMVRFIGENYSRFGDSVASAVLQKCLIEDGVQLLVTKLGMSPEGDDAADHRQIIHYIEEQGVQKFCEVVGVRGAVKESEKEAPSVSSSKVKVAQNLSGPTDQAAGKSHKLNVEQVNVKPVSLSDGKGGQRDPAAADTQPAPPRQNRTVKPFPFAHKNMTPPPEEDFQEPMRLDATPAAKPDSLQPAKGLQRVKAAPLPLPKGIAKPQERKEEPPPERSPADYLRNITEEED